MSNHTLTEGETALLSCVGYAFPDVEITWTYNDQTISNSSHVSVSAENIIREGRFLHQSLLQIQNVRIADTGAYTCTVGNGETSVSSSIQLSVSGRAVSYN